MKKEIITRRDLKMYMEDTRASYADIASNLGVSENTIRRLATVESKPLPKRYRLALLSLLQGKAYERQT